MDARSRNLTANERRAIRIRSGDPNVTREQPPTPGEVLWDLGLALAGFLGVALLAQLVLFVIQIN